MVNFLLQFTAELENLTNLQPQGGADNPDFPYFFKLKCGNCGELTQKETCVTLSKTVPLPNGRGTTHLVQKCKFCGREATVLMIPGRGRPLTGELAECEKLVPLMQFDCRGMEPVEFRFGKGWEAQSELQTKFTEIDLSDGDFVEYDEKGKCAVSISNLKSCFDVVK
ncbi:uncharacterized protein LOC131222810 [Magnolia sinica]|uniref:uncharacterized protein LOC131222810 n=1 Tax=Magnolia sinica TaxID=86752 RepID=UPI002657B2FF|nr:uncharacterized protein LOC131222810 [Magnolia sinica]